MCRIFHRNGFLYLLPWRVAVLVMANLGGQLHVESTKVKLLSALVWNFLSSPYLKQKDTPWAISSGGSPHRRTWKKGTLPCGCLPSLLLTCSSILLWRYSLNTIRTYFGFQHRQEDHWYPVSPLSLWHQTWAVKTSSLVIWKIPILSVFPVWNVKYPLLNYPDCSL